VRIGLFTSAGRAGTDEGEGKRKKGREGERKKKEGNPSFLFHPSLPSSNITRPHGGAGKQGEGREGKRGKRGKAPFRSLVGLHV